MGPSHSEFELKSLKKLPYLGGGGVYGPLDSECNVLHYICTFLQGRKFLVFTEFCKEVVTL